MSDWKNSCSYIHKKIDVYVNRKIDMNVKHTENAIQDLCEMRDLHHFELFDNTEIEQFIQYLCTKWFICILYIYEMQILYEYVGVSILFILCFLLFIAVLMYYFDSEVKYYSCALSILPVMYE